MKTRAKAVSFLILSVFPFLSGCGESSQKEKEMKSTDVFAMDTYMNLKAYGSSAEKALSVAEKRIRDLERTLSVTEEGSDIWNINHAEGQAVTVSDDTVSVLQTALNTGRESGGALRVTLYPVLRAWGFTTGSYQIPDSYELDELLRTCDDSQIQLTGNTVSVPERSEIDLGAVAKGYTGDAVIETFRSNGITEGIINLGGNVQTLGSRPDGSAWSVGITDPFSPDEMLGIVEVRDQAVITSGNYERFFTAEDGKKYWHIIDPADGCPADNGLVSVTVIGACGADCDALSTALFVEGEKGAVEHWRRSGSFEMICVTDSGSVLVTEGISGSFELLSDMPRAVIHHDEAK